VASADFVAKAIEGVLAHLVVEIKESIGLPFQIDAIPKTFKITTAFIPTLQFDISFSNGLGKLTVRE